MIKFKTHSRFTDNDSSTRWVDLIFWSTTGVAINNGAIESQAPLGDRKKVWEVPKRKNFRLSPTGDYFFLLLLLCLRAEQAEFSQLFQLEENVRKFKNSLPQTSVVRTSITLQLFVKYWLEIGQWNAPGNSTNIHRMRDLHEKGKINPSIFFLSEKIGN